MKQKQGLLIVVSGPAGSGKGTVLHELMTQDDRFAYSVSATTRKPRSGEIDGVHYFFLSREEFEARIAADEMLEHADYCGNYYGTPKKEALRQLENGKFVVLEIDTQGALQVKEKYPDAVLIMLLPPSFSELERRLRTRGTEAPDVIERRLNVARKEIAGLSAFDFVVINETGMAGDVARQIIGIADASTHAVGRNHGIESHILQN